MFLMSALREEDWVSHVALLAIGMTLHETAITGKMYFFYFSGSLVFRRFFEHFEKKSRPKKLKLKKTQAIFPKNSSKLFENSIFCQLE